MGLQIPRGVHPEATQEAIFGALRKHLGEVFQELAPHKESKMVEGHLMPDHVHMCISIPPKYAVSNVVGYIKGKSAIRSRGSSEGDRGTSRGRSSGPEATSFPR